MATKDVRQHVERIVSSVSGRKSIEQGLIPGLIQTSWERSLESYGIDPSQDEPVCILTANELKAHTEPIDNFLRIAKVGVQHLHQRVADLGYSTLLCDAKGVTVDWRGNQRFEREWKAAGLYLGAVWNEAREGTCGVGTALVDQLPLTVHKGEHFRVKNSGLTCSCSPIIGPQGQTMGLIDVSALSSSDSKDSQHLALQLVIQAARLIESAYFFYQFQDKWVLCLSHERELADVSSEFLLALNEEGKILAADWVANRVLGSETANGSLAGYRIDQVFDLDFEKLLQITQGSTLALPLFSQRIKRKLYASLRSPSSISLDRSKATASVSGFSAAQKSRRSFKKSGSAASLDTLSGADPKLQKNVQRIKRVMNKPIPILLSGETGTGKEMFARAIHYASQRASQPFVAVNCAAIPESLIESELFGYNKGAFTGADKKGMKGKILQAHKGTLFLDEIGDMPARLQPRLLRVLAEREVIPLGGDQAIAVDFRLICATHRNLQELVECGKFRDDLYYRLNGILFELPPLRKRQDVGLLIDEILQLENRDSPASVVLNNAAMAVLLDYPWPGNIRQLRNCLRYALAICENGIIGVEDLPADIAQSSLVAQKRSQACFLSTRLPVSREHPPLQDDDSPLELNASEKRERKILLAALQQHKWQVSKATQETDISRATMYRKMKKYQIIPPNKR